MFWCRAPLWGPWPDFSFSFCFAGQLFCSSSWGALSDERTGLQFVVQSVSGHSRGEHITIHYCLIWDYWVPFPSPLTTRRDYGGSILTHLHTGRFHCKNCFIRGGLPPINSSWAQASSGSWQDFFFATEPLRPQSLCNVLSDEKADLLLMNILGLCQV
jgi:hypothetical protein